MYSPSDSSLASAAGTTVANLPRYITATRSDKREDFVELGRNEKNGLAGSAGFAKAGVNELDCTDVHAASRLRREKNGEVATHLSGDDDFLLISAGQIASRQIRDRWPDVERLDLRLGVCVDAVGIEKSVVRKIGLESEYEIVGDRIVENQSSAVTVFGNV